MTFYSNDHGDVGMGSLGAAPARANGVGLMVPTSRIKRALGLKTLKRSPSRRSLSGSVGSSAGGSNPSSPNAGHGSGSPRFAQTLPATRTRRPLTSAEIMRQQMRVTEQSDNRLRKTLMRTLVGQVRIYPSVYEEIKECVFRIFVYFFLVRVTALGNECVSMVFAFWEKLFMILVAFLLPFWYLSLFSEMISVFLRLTRNSMSQLTNWLNKTDGQAGGDHNSPTGAPPPPKALGIQ